MNYTSFQFVIFFTLIYGLNLLYFKISQLFNRKTDCLYKVLLLVESYVLIGIYDLGALLCLLILTTVCFVIFKCFRVSKKSMLVGVAFAVCQLCAFKYYHFMAGTLCTAIGITYTAKSHYVPIGISFFTFSAISYLIDQYKKKQETEWIDLSLYLSFFPKFLSGPLVRFEDFNCQVQRGTTRMSLENFRVGIQLVLWGMMKKVVFADHLALFVDDVFLAPNIFSSFTCVWAIVSYALQIYLDFSGYSDMAIGFSKMLGFDIKSNFNIPYISKNISEFWKRWHISLSTWLKDYIYIPLGGNRKGKRRTEINLFLTMLIGGLWHGASWNFVIWGAFHGIALIIHKKWKKISNIRLGNICSIILTNLFVSVMWVFFRASSMKNALMLLQRTILFQKGINHIYTWTGAAIVFVLIEILYAKQQLKKEKSRSIDVSYPILELKTIKDWFFFFVLFGTIIMFAYVGDTAFIYGKF